MRWRLVDVVPLEPFDLVPPGVTVGLRLALDDAGDELVDLVERAAAANGVRLERDDSPRNGSSSSSSVDRKGKP